MQTGKRIRISRSLGLALASGAAIVAVAAAASAQQRVEPRLRPPILHPGVATSAKPVVSAVPSTAATTTTTISGEGQTSDQKVRFNTYIDRTNATIHAEVHAGGKAVTDDERKVVKEHWRISTRLLRIRDVAEDSKDAASIATVDADLALLDAHLSTKLKALNAKAPK